MNANASGMPAKLAATPEKVVSTERTTLGVPSRIAAYAIRKPSRPPTSGGDEAHLDAVLVRRDVGLVRKLLEVREREAALDALEGADEHLPGGQEEEEDRVGEEGDDAEPGKGRTPAAGSHRPRETFGLERAFQRATTRPSSASPS